jgi:hypothetical protein
MERDMRRHLPLLLGTRRRESLKIMIQFAA